MKWLVLLILFSCSTKKETAPTVEATEASQATESEAKPVSPYSVKPCYCMKIYKPVCAEGRNFGNSCEAECQGHIKWTEGNCKK